ncbi:hypothetical protein LCGC14_3034550, partial [marine sediment metagenome]
MSIVVELWNNDLATPEYIEEISGRIQGLKFSTKLPGGFTTCSFALKADLPEAWEWLVERTFQRIVIKDGKKILWEGRIEDNGLEAGRATVVAYGYYASLTDEPFYAAFNDDVDVVVKAVLTANCPEIDNTDHTHIAAVATAVVNTEADADLTPQALIEKLIAFSNTDSRIWDFAIWENRLAWLVERNVSALDWKVYLSDFNRFKLKRRGGSM